MGLLEKINSLQNTASVGLLARASQLSTKSNSFSDWAAKYSITHAAIFSKVNNFYYISNSLNIDARTITLSVSTADFWSGSIDFNDNKIHCYSKSDGTLGRFFQFFREDLRHDVDELYFLPYTYKGNTNILMILKKQEEELTVPQVTEQLLNELAVINSDAAKKDESHYSEVLSNIDESLQANLFILSYKLSLDSLFNGIDISQPEIKDLIIKSITKVLCEKLTILFSAPNCVSNDTNNEFKIVFLTKEEVDDKLLLAHIKSCLSNFLGEKSADSLVLLIAGVTKSEKGAVTFLIKG